MLKDNQMRLAFHNKKAIKKLKGAIWVYSILERKTIQLSKENRKHGLYRDRKRK